MGKGDKKSRRGKIIMGSTGVRRPKPSKRKAAEKLEAAPVKTVIKVKKVAEKPKVEPKPKPKVAQPVAITEPKPKLKVAEPVAVTEPEKTVVPVKTVKKAVKKAKAEDAPE